MLAFQFPGARLWLATRKYDISPQQCRIRELRIFPCMAQVQPMPNKELMLKLYSIASEQNQQNSFLFPNALTKTFFCCFLGKVPSSASKTSKNFLFFLPLQNQAKIFNIMASEEIEDPLKWCFFCDKKSQKVCSFCQNVGYCSDKCWKIHRPETMCFPFKVGYAEHVGRYMIAARNIKASGKDILL